MLLKLKAYNYPLPVGLGAAATVLAKSPLVLLIKAISAS
jgi:hypothetical protein